MKDEDDLEKTRNKREEEEEGTRGSSATPTNEVDEEENTHS